MTDRKPNFFIVGAPKAGTTALYRLLSYHPDVFLSPIKEPHYFSTDFDIAEFAADYRRINLCDLTEYLKSPVLQSTHIAHTPNQKQYLELFRDAGCCKAIGEASSGYLYSSLASQNIHNFRQDAKIIMILRDPVSRAYSHYKMDRPSGRARGRSFLEALKIDYENPSKAWGGKHLYVELGLYHNQVQRYLELFPRNQLKIILYEDWIKDNAKIFPAVCDFLEIRHITPEKSNCKFNSPMNPRFDFLHEFTTRLRLHELKKKYFPNVTMGYLKKLWYSSSPYPQLSTEERLTASHYFTDDISKLRLLLDKTDLWKSSPIKDNL